jgi:OOP family OmpA-OmpF porin
MQTLQIQQYRSKFLFKGTTTMKKIIVASLLLASCALAMAEPYVGGSIGYARNNSDCPSGFSCSLNSTGLKAFVGYSFSPMFALEASYFDLGKLSAESGPASVNMKSSGYGLRGLVSVPFNTNLSGFAAVGINSVKSKATARFGNLSADVDGTSTKPSLALGLDYAVTPAFKLRGEVEQIRFEAPGGAGNYNITNFNVGLKYGF